MSSGLWLGIAAGASAALALEAVTLRARLRSLRDRRPVLPLIVGGFLTRLTLLVGGTLLGTTGLWDPQAFLLTAVAVILVGEAYAFARIHRHRPPADPSSPSDSSST